MNKLLKYIFTNTYKPLLVKYLSKTRTYKYQGIILSIPQQVFHPGFFFSTKLLLRYVRQLPLLQKSFLELGAGSGLISIVASKQGALVTASDINPIAVEFLKKNRLRNETQMQIIHSDLFDNIPLQKFDIIAINPPYYKRQPRSEADYAWCCGEKGEYFERLLNGLGPYMHFQSTVLLILCDGCDLKMIQEMAHNHRFQLECVYKKQSLIEKNFIFKIKYVE